MLTKLTDFREKLSPGIRQVLGNTIWLFSEKIWQLVLGLLVGVWVARYLGTRDFGLLNIATAITGVFSPLAKLGLDNIVIRDIARDPTQKNETLGTAFFLKLISSSVILLLSVGTSFLLVPQDNLVHWMVLIVAISMILQSGEVIDFWFQSQVQAKYSVWARNIAYLLINIVKVTLLINKAPVIMFAVVIAAEQAMAVLGFFIMYRWQGNLIRAWKVSLNRAKTLVKDSWPLILSGIVIMVYMRIDQVMLAQMRNAEEVGIYSAAVKISELWYFVPAAVINSVFPSLVQAREVSEATYYGRIQKLFNIMVVLAYSVAIPITFLSDYIVYLIYGAKFTGAGIILTIHIWTGVFAALGGAREVWLTTEGLMKFSAVTTAIGAAINVVLNLLFIPKYGGMGAAVATVIAQITSAYAIGAFYAPTRKIFIRQTKALFLVGWLRS